MAIRQSGDPGLGYPEIRKSGTRRSVPDLLISGFPSPGSPVTRISGFSLIEVMIAVSILALGTVVIHQNFLRSASYFSNYANTLKASLWMQEKLWEGLQESLYSKEGEAQSGEGSVLLGQKNFEWSQKVDVPSENFYRILLTMQWEEGPQPPRLTKEIYGFKTEPSKG